jgi:thymidylate kinase
MRAPWIVVEGPEGTGETSLARLLDQRLGARSLATPGAELETIREIGRQMGQACEEGAETFHDNFGWEDGDR